MAFSQVTKDHRILSFANQLLILTRNRRHVCTEAMTNQRIILISTNLWLQTVMQCPSEWTWPTLRNLYPRQKSAWTPGPKYAKWWILGLFPIKSCSGLSMTDRKQIYMWSTEIKRKRAGSSAKTTGFKQPFSNYFTKAPFLENKVQWVSFTLTDSFIQQILKKHSLFSGHFYRFLGYTAKEIKILKHIARNLNYLNFLFLFLLKTRLYHCFNILYKKQDSFELISKIIFFQIIYSFLYYWAYAREMWSLWLFKRLRLKKIKIKIKG